MAGEIVGSRSDDGMVRVQTRLKNETLWTSQGQLTELFQTSKQNISHQIRSIYAECELDPQATVKNCLTVQREGKSEIQRQIEHYNLDMLISVGYRV